MDRNHVGSVSLFRGRPQGRAADHSLSDHSLSGGSESGFEHRGWIRSQWPRSGVSLARAADLLERVRRALDTVAVAARCDALTRRAGDLL